MRHSDLRRGGAYIRYRLGVSRSVPGHQLARHRRQLPPHRAVVNPVAHPHHHAAEDVPIGAEMSPDLLPDGLRQPLDDLFLEPRVRLLEERDARVHAVELRVHQRVILLRNFSEEPRPAAPHHRLEKPHELGVCQVPGRPLEHRRLRGLGHPWRRERHGDALVGGDRTGHRLHQPAVPLDLREAARVARQEQGLGIVARDGGALHRASSRAPPASRPARYSVTKRRLASESRFASISFDAAAIERSTASRRRSRIAFSFSLSISLRARSSSCSYCSRAWASSVARSFSATVRACAMSSCASARAAAIRRLCSARSAAASSRSRAASASMRSSFFSRSRTAASSNGHALRRNTNSSSPNTTRVQMTRPPSTESGPAPPVAAGSWTSAASIKTRPSPASRTRPRRRTALRLPPGPPR